MIRELRLTRSPNGIAALRSVWARSCSVVCQSRAVDRAREKDGSTFVLWCCLPTALCHFRIASSPAQTRRKKTSVGTQPETDLAAHKNRGRPALSPESAAKIDSRNRAGVEQWINVPPVFFSVLIFEGGKTPLATPWGSIVAWERRLGSAMDMEPRRPFGLVLLVFALCNISGNDSMASPPYCIATCIIGAEKSVHMLSSHGKPAKEGGVGMRGTVSK